MRNGISARFTSFEVDIIIKKKQKRFLEHRSSSRINTNINLIGNDILTSSRPIMSATFFLHDMA